MMMRTRRALAGLLLALAAQTVPADDSLPADDRLGLADGLYARDMFELAAAEYTAYLQAPATSNAAATAQFRLGECYRALGRVPDADKAYQTLIAGHPDNPLRHRAALRRGDLRLENNRPAEARALYRAALDAQPPADIAAAALYFEADAARKAGDPDGAAASLERIRRDFAASEYGAYALLKLGELRAGQSLNSPGDDVIALYAQALTNAPTPRVAAEARFQLAEARYARGEFAQSAALYRQLLAEHPDDLRTPRARLRGAWAAHQAGLYADALALADRSLAQAPAAERADWLYMKANSQRQLVRDAEALATYEELLALAAAGPLAEAARLELALTLYHAGRYADAIAAARNVTPGPDNRKDVYWLLAESNAALGRDDEAIQYYRLIATEFPQSDIAADAMYRLAYRLQARGDTREAARFYERVTAAFPDHALAPQALFAAGCCLAAHGEDDAAVRLWSRLIERHPAETRVAETLYRKALGEIRLARRDQAIATCRSLLERFPQSPFVADAHFWQGALLREAGRPDDAERALRNALAAKPRLELERECQLNLALILHQRGALAEAADRLFPLLDTPTRRDLTPSLLQWLAEFADSRGETDRCASAADALVAVSTNDAGRQIGWVLAGRARLAGGRVDEATAALTNALALPTRTAYAAEAAWRLGLLSLNASNAPAAAARFEQAAALAADDSLTGMRARAYAGLGHAAKAQRLDADAARSVLSVAVLYDDPDLVPACLGEAALAFQRAGRTNDAHRTAAELCQRYPAHAWVATLHDAGLGTNPPPANTSPPPPP